MGARPISCGGPAPALEAPPLAPPVAVEASSEENLAHLCSLFAGEVSRQIGKADDFYIGEGIPEKKLVNATITCRVQTGSNERVIGLIDTTVMGSAKNALVFTNEGRICFHDDSGGFQLTWDQVKTCIMEPKMLKVIFGGHNLAQCSFDHSGSSLNSKTIITIITIFRDLYGALPL